MLRPEHLRGLWVAPLVRIFLLPVGLRPRLATGWLCWLNLCGLWLMPGRCVFVGAAGLSQAGRFRLRPLVGSGWNVGERLTLVCDGV